MRLVIPILLLFCCFPNAVYSQTGSVRLYDASGNLLDSFASIQAAYDAIPEPLSKAYSLTVTSAYKGRQPWETFPVRFTEKAGSSAAHTITLDRLDAAQWPN